MFLSVAHLATAQNPPSPAGSAETFPLSPAQTALFDTPHLANVTSPETLRYAYQQVGPAEFSDTILVHVKAINSDGSKDLSFDYLTGPHHVPFPPIGDFRGNPLLMLALEQDVDDMKRALGLSQAFLRNRIREAFFNAATVTATTVTVDGKTVPAREVTIRPFAETQRLEKIPSLQSKRYSFTIAESVPGMIEAITIDTPPDPDLKAAALTKTITFTGVSP